MSKQRDEEDRFFRNAVGNTGRPPLPDPTPALPPMDVVFESLCNDLWRHSYRGGPGWNGAIANLWAYVQILEKAAYSDGVDAMKNAVLGVLAPTGAPDVR